jgi:Mg-chelatase subunit ChlD
MVHNDSARAATSSARSSAVRSSALLAIAGLAALGLSCEGTSGSAVEGGLVATAPAASPAASSRAAGGGDFREWKAHVLPGEGGSNGALHLLGYQVDWRGIDAVADPTDDGLLLERERELAQELFFERVLPRLSFEELLAMVNPLEEESPEDYFQRQLMTRPFVPARIDAVSTFGLETDTASYTISRAQIEAGNLPSAWSVRPEEFVHAIDSDIPAPVRGDFAVSTDLVPSPFGDADAWMLRVGLRARDVREIERGPIALTFVVDRSGSMGSPERMPMVKHVLGLLAERLDARDQVAVVVYSNQAEVLVPPARGDELARAMDAIHSLQPSGGTNLDAGLTLGCEVAADAFVEGAQNFVVVLSDGLGNIGETEADALLAKTASARARGLFLNTVGVGMGARDRFLERLADAGDGRCDYVDREEEAKRAFVDRFTGAFQVVAKDAKLQVEFDPALVGRWRLIGFENRALADADFADDAVDAGEIGAGHSVAALYELEDVVLDGDRPLGEVRLRYMSQERSEATEAHWPIALDGLYGDWNAAPYSLRAQVCMAQFAEFLAGSVHAANDAPHALVAEANGIAAAWPNADFAGATLLMASAEPLLDERMEHERSDQVLGAARQLAFAHYQHLLEARRDPSSAETAATAGQVAVLEAAFEREIEAAATRAR